MGFNLTFKGLISKLHRTDVSFSKTFSTDVYIRKIGINVPDTHYNIFNTTKFTSTVLVTAYTAVVCTTNMSIVW